MFSDSDRQKTIQMLKELLQNETATLAVVVELSQGIKIAELKELFAEARNLHGAHRTILERLIQSMTTDSAMTCSTAPTSIEAFVKSANSNPRARFAFILSLETHLSEIMLPYKELRLSVVDKIIREQDAFTEQVNIAIQRLTRILPTNQLQ